jgi:nitrogen PTS system EIIA component
MQPVAFDAVDDRDVDLVFLLLAPETAGADHLHALATVSRLLRDPRLCGELRAAKDADALERLLTTAASAQAA